ncbi:MAG: MFS transporter [Desulfitobacteriaceae bacterium]|nr:MFS transporter [Desulfitobacteriaceae bacterium]MDI6878383.1 MFS transporter [Desulfitobacteriaceae bacterium]MDI6913279.1 MFS transporter [Desulfitobacteriaceae bacterium]
MAQAETQATKSMYSVPQRMERLPMSSYQNMIFLIIATAWLFDSIDLGMLTFVLGSLKTHFHLSVVQTGLLSSASFLGMFFGAAIAGMLADRFGRKIVFQWSMVLWGLGSFLSAFSPSAEMLGISRILVGFGMGMEFPIGQSLISEFIPAKNRGRYIAFLEGFWPLGFITAGILAYFILPVGGWRWVFIAQGIPAIFVLFIRRVVPESPRWLESRGRDAEANQVMTTFEEHVKHSLGLKELPQPSGKSFAAVVGEQKFSFMDLWAPGYAKRTLMVWALWFFALLGYYGLTTWLGAFLQQAGYSVTKSVFYTLLISLAGLPGFVSAAYLLEIIGRKGTVALMLFGSAIAAYFYGTAGSVTTLIAFGLCMQFFLFGMWSSIYAYTPELYPTRARATGAGFASALGRLGSLLGPYIVGVLLPITGHTGIFTLGAASFVVAALVVLLFGVETKGKVLEEISG